MISLAGFMLILPISIIYLLKDLCGISNSRRKLMRMKSEQEILLQKVKMVSRSMEIKRSDDGQLIGRNATEMTCKNCGAPFDGTGKCRYCGTQYLITNKTSL